MTRLVRMLLDVYGSLYHAGAHTLEALLPDPQGADGPAVVLGLRGRTALGATSFKMIATYADRGAAVKGRFLLSGIQPTLLDQLRRAGRVEDHSVQVFPATKLVGDRERGAVNASSPTAPALAYGGTRASVLYCVAASDRILLQAPR